MYHFTDELHVVEQVEALHHAADHRQLVAQARRAAAAAGVPLEEQRRLPGWRRLRTTLFRLRPRWLPS